MGFYGAMRGPSSREELEIAWTYPRYEEPKSEARGNKDGRSISKRRRAALPLDQAFAALAGEDRRPLLVLRECLTCTGTDDALLTKQADNERTMLMSRWFHCVKLPPDVLKEDHPFHALFAGDDPAHLFVSRHDGGSRMDLNGAQSRSELWDEMGKILELEYASKYEKAVKGLLKVCNELDKLDDKIGQLELKLEAAIEKYGPDSKKLGKIQKELKKLTAQRAAVREDATRISKLKLREEPPRQAGNVSGEKST